MRNHHGIAPAERSLGAVRLAGRIVPLSAVRREPERFARLFTIARAEVGFAECMCRTPPPQLVIRCSRAGRYHLAGWPGEGGQHSVDCDFYKVASALSGRSGYTEGAIVETESGTSIRLASPLTRRLKPGAMRRAAVEQQSSGSRRSLGLLGLVHWLWEQAQLSTWHPTWKRRCWRTCHIRLLEQTLDCTVNRHELASSLFVVPPFRREDAARTRAAFEVFRAGLGAHGISERHGLIVGEIKQIAPTPYGARVSLAHLPGTLFASAGLILRARRSYRPALSSVAGAEARRVGLFLVDRSPKGYVVIVDMAVMLTNRAYIPADSSHEVVMADALARAGRSFMKPLRYDGSDEVFPDFVLLDDPQVYVEVYGVQGRDEYEERKRAKQAYYREAGIPLIEWDVTEPLPDLSQRGRGA